MIGRKNELENSEKLYTKWFKYMAKRNPSVSSTLKTPKYNESQLNFKSRKEDYYGFK
jgi:hypothetical protein